MAISGNKKRISVSLTKDQNEELERLAKEKGFSKSAIIALALERFIKNERLEKEE